MNQLLGNSRDNASSTRPLLTLLFACLMVPGVLGAAEPQLPKGETILDNYVKVTGGKAAYDRQNNIVSKSTLDIPKMGMKAAITDYRTRSGKSYTVVEMDGVGKTERGVNDGVVWELSLMAGPVLKEGEEKALMLRAAFFDAVVGWREIYKQAECVGLEEIEGRPCYKVIMTPNEGPTETRHYDQETGLVAKNELTVKLPMGAIPIELYPSDYREEGGILMAHKIRRLSMGTEMVITIDSVQVNAKFPEGCFALPPEVKALVDEPQAFGKQQNKP